MTTTILELEKKIESPETEKRMMLQTNEKVSKEHEFMRNPRCVQEVGRKCTKQGHHCHKSGRSHAQMLQ